MYHRNLLKSLITGLGLLLIFAACSTPGEPTPTTEAATPAPAPAVEEPTATVELVTGEASVESVEVRVQGADPVQVSAVVRGTLPDDCTEIAFAIQTVSGADIKITLLTSRPAHADCAEGAIPFEEVIQIDVAGLPAGEHTVTVNEVSGAFTLTEGQIIPAPTFPAVEAEFTPPPDDVFGGGQFEEMGIKITVPEGWTVERLPGVYGLVPPDAEPGTYPISFSFLMGIPTDSLDTVIEMLSARFEEQGNSGFTFEETTVDGVDAAQVTGLRDICRMIVIPGGAIVRTVIVSPEACDEDGAITDQAVQDILDSITLFEPGG